MDLSLSIVLPVHNAQSSLVRDVQLLLEIVSDITPQFEILIVDDASSDHTEEVAHELSREYPQLRVARHDKRLGQAAAVESALKLTSGDVVFVQDEGGEIRAAEIRQLWQMRNDRDLVMARAATPRRALSPHLLERLHHWGEQLRHAEAESRGGVQMIRREAVEQLDQSGPDAPCRQVPAPNFLPAAVHPADV